jgi:demethylmenaquinone methyltransferase/2-methoxy-6-polyprenyl-1,4-benzoquinol methylase
VDPVDEQVEYYRQRAREYDRWWWREGRYRLPPEDERRWFADVAEVEAALDRFAPRGDVLEYAGGTGLWTRHLLRHARHVTVVDAAPEMIALNRARAPAHEAVTFVRADIFSWTPPAAGFDVCFFAYWLTHVPDDRLAAFWSRVAGALRPGGRVFLVDSHHPEPLPGHVQRRTLDDGREFTVVKRLRQPAELTAAARRLGWRLEVAVTAHGGILYASGTPGTG